MRTENCRQAERWAGFVVSQTNGEVPGLEFLVCLHLSLLCKPCVYMTCELRLGAGKRSVTLDMADWLLSWRAFQLGWFTTCWQTFYVEKHWVERPVSLPTLREQPMRQTYFDKQVRRPTTSLNTDKLGPENVNTVFAESEALIKIGRHRSSAWTCHYSSCFSHKTKSGSKSLSEGGWYTVRFLTCQLKLYAKLPTYLTTGFRWGIKQWSVWNWCQRFL